ncbi:hypothetical protein ACFPIJ_24995 [Dactylosporangium cerinum]|uniref:WxL domain-containing protein n=1 Tax=Dactylosporangium cerinum TaxID=1434730 RepID=A0ABV9VY73_9ACTN
MRREPKTSRYLVVIGLTLVMTAGSLVGSTAAHAQMVDSGTFSLVSDPGDPLGHGQSYSYSAAAGDQLDVTSRTGEALDVSVHGRNGDSWTLNLQMASQRPMSPGTYSVDKEYPSNSFSEPAMSVTDGGFPCRGVVTGSSFTISAIDYGPTPGYIRGLDASFSLHCGGIAPALHGVVHIANAPAPLVAVALSLGVPDPQNPGRVQHQLDPRDPIQQGTMVIPTATVTPAISAYVNFRYDDNFPLSGGWDGLGVAHGSPIVPNPGFHTFTMTLTPTDWAYPAITPAAVLPVMVVSAPPVLSMSATPASPVTAPDTGSPDPITLTIGGIPRDTPGSVRIYDGTTDLGPADTFSSSAGTATKSVVLSPAPVPHGLIAVFTPAAISALAQTSAVVPYSMLPCTCGIRGYVPLNTNNTIPPFAGGLSLQLAPGTHAHLTQVDPTTAAGHPVQATDPTQHRHAWVFTGSLDRVAVVDTRPDQPGWTLTGQASAFVNGTTTVSAVELGWAPQLQTTGSDAEGSVTPGPQVNPRMQQGNSLIGLQSGSVLGSASPGSGLGTQNLRADLTLWIPDTSPTGTYVSTLTLTLISP